MSTKDVDKVYGRLIPEYIHIVSYYGSNPASPAAAIEGLLESLDDVGVDEGGAGHNVTIRASASESGTASPGSDWKLDNDLNQYRFCVDGGSAKAIVKHDLGAMASSLDRIELKKYAQKRQRSEYSHLWAIEYGGARSLPHMTEDAFLRLSIRTSYFIFPYEIEDEAYSESERACFTDDRSLRLIDKVVQLFVDAGDVHNLWVDCSWARESDGGKGFSHGPPSIGMMGLRSLIEHELWDQAGDGRKDKVRGMFWGMYLAPWHLDKLGGKESFAQEYMSVVERPPRWEEYIRDYPGKGLFIRLSSSLMDLAFTEFPPGGVRPDTSLWLYRRLREADLLL